MPSLSFGACSKRQERIVVRRDGSEPGGELLLTSALASSPATFVIWLGSFREHFRAVLGWERVATVTFGDFEWDAHRAAASVA